MKKHRGDLAIFYLKHLSMLLQSAETIVDVFDRYDLKDSIKSAPAIFFMTSGFRKVPAKYKVCSTGKGLLALTNFEINSPRKLINSCLFLLIDKNVFQSGMLLPSYFGDLAIFYLKHLSMLLQSAEAIVDVFDRYDLKDSIKSAERECRCQAAGGHRIYHVNEG
jgi:hypothetical protein